ncbi:MAG: hypothetical protein KGL63_00990 [Betaproteobacteria bacterium]|nr:hypothetical protein [Betaproteobacteria bacterium]
MKYKSSTVLRSIWERFAAEYAEHCGRTISMRETCHLLDFDSSALAKWTNKNTPAEGRIPIRHLPALREVLMMTNEEYDQLVEARLIELKPDNETVIACTWLVETLTQELQAGLLGNEELAVLQAFRKARKKYPRGLYFDGEESGLLEVNLEHILKRAQHLHEEEEASEAEVSISQEKLDAVRNKLKDLLVPKLKKQRRTHFLAERNRIKDELRNRRVNAHSNV